MNRSSAGRTSHLMALSALALLFSVSVSAQNEDEARERIEQRANRPVPQNAQSPRFQSPANRPAAQPASPQAAPAPQSGSTPQSGAVPRPPGAARGPDNRPQDPRAVRWGTGVRAPNPPRHAPPISSYRTLPPGYHRYGYRGSDYYFFSGYWYSPYPYGYRLIRPPRGLLVYDLPPYYSMYWYGGRSYYYANDVYYLWDAGERGYVVTDPPAGAVEQEIAADIYVYPTRGQNEEQQATDRYECHRWATDQTGFDPTQVGGGVQPEAAVSRRADYRRAETACLEGRGYSVQ